MKSFIPSFAVVSVIIFFTIAGDYFLSTYFSQENNTNTIQPEIITEKVTPSITTMNPRNSPQIIQPTKQPIFTSQITSSPKESQPIIISPSSNIFITALRKNNITNISTLPSYQNSFLFNTFPINRTDNNISITTTEYRENYKDQSLQREYMKIYEFNIYEQSIENAYNMIKKSIEFQLKNNPEAKIVEVNQYGGKSFVIRLESNQKTMYLVIESKGRLLGIEYRLGENFSRHRDLNKVLKTLFPLSQ